MVSSPMVPLNDRESEPFNELHNQTSNTLDASAPRYWLAPHVYVAVVNQSAIALNLRTEKYLGIDAQASEVLGQMVHDWPREPRRRTTIGRSLPQAAMIEIVAHFVDEGLITLKATSSKPFNPKAPIDPEKYVALGSASDEERPLTGADVVNFICAYVRARVSLATKRLDLIAEAVHRRKKTGLRSTHFDVGIAEQLVTVFRRLRPFVFNGEDQCLVQSLTFIHFCATYGQFPTWIIGVRTRPFSAHSWVQEGEFVLDGSPEEIMNYVPIVAI